MTDNDTQAQVDALRAKAEGMGLHWASFQVAVTYLLVAIGGEETITQLSPAWLDTAATLLGALDPDAMTLDSLKEKFTKFGYKVQWIWDNIPNPDDDHEWVLVKRRKVPRPPCAGCGGPSEAMWGTVPTCKRCHDNYIEGHKEMDRLMEEEPYHG